ncbi:hypothetical protein LCGC14_1558610 [marine sediment metagenome]|uniref:Uncharacterized protein n=1 Tax=marine sediment metagenome TaxID=412755 RepID=A0A0F9IN65_9ZZZZ
MTKLEEKAHYVALGALATSPEAIAELDNILTCFAEKWRAWIICQTTPQPFRDAFDKEE